MMDVVRKLSEFFDNSLKRQQHLISKIRVMMPAANHFVLVNVCRTRWMERIDGMDRIVELLIFTQLWLHLKTFQSTEMLLTMGTGIKTVEMTHKP